MPIWEMDYSVISPNRRSFRQGFENIFIQGETIEFTLIDGDDLINDDFARAQQAVNWRNLLALDVVDQATNRSGRRQTASRNLPLVVRYTFHYTGTKQINLTGTALPVRRPPTMTVAVDRQPRRPRFPAVNISFEFQVISQEDYRRRAVGSNASRQTTSGSSRGSRRDEARVARTLETRAEERSARVEALRERREENYPQSRTGLLVGIHMPTESEVGQMTAGELRSHLVAVQENVESTPALDLRPKNGVLSIRFRGGSVPMPYKVFPRFRRLNGRIILSWRPAISQRGILPTGRRYEISDAEIDAHQRRWSDRREFSANDWLVVTLGETELELNAVDILLDPAAVFNTRRSWRKALIQADDLADHEDIERLWRLFEAAGFIVGILTLFIPSSFTGRTMSAVRRGVRQTTRRTITTSRLSDTLDLSRGIGHAERAAQGNAHRALGPRSLGEQLDMDSFEEALDEIIRDASSPRMGALDTGMMHHYQASEAAEILRDLRAQAARGDQVALQTLDQLPQRFMSVDPSIPRRPGRTPRGVNVNPNPALQSMHPLAQSVVRDLPEINTNNMMTRLELTGRGHVHTVFDQNWQRDFRTLRGTGQTTVTAREAEEIFRDAAARTFGLSPAERETLIELVRANLYFDLGLSPHSILRIPGT